MLNFKHSCTAISFWPWHGKAPQCMARAVAAVKVHAEGPHSQGRCVEARLGEHVAQVHSKQLQVGLIQAAEHVPSRDTCMLLVQRLQPKYNCIVRHPIAGLKIGVERGRGRGRGDSRQ